jgi:prepilin-type N-terminal cleavage/methylation domain-containing protein
MRGRARRAAPGFTLVEMMIGIAVVVGLSLAMAATFSVGFTTIRQEGRAIAADTTVSSASLPLTRDLSASSLTSTALGGGPGNPLKPGIGRVTLTYGSGASRTAVTYVIDAAGTLTRQANAGAASVVARGLSSLTMSNSGCQWTVTLVPSAIGASARSLTVSQRNQGCF